MRIDVSEEPPTFLAEYSSIPIAFEIRKIYDVASPARPGDEFALSANELWKRFESRTTTRSKKTRRSIGKGASTSQAGACLPLEQMAGTPAVRLWSSAPRTSGCWKAGPTWRSCGTFASRRTCEARSIGYALLQAAERWTAERGGSLLKVETQNTNVPACEFYARNGFVLRAANQFVYPEFPEEIQLLWYKEF